MGVPSSWPDLLARLAAQLGGDGADRSAEEWLREAIEAVYRKPTGELRREERHVAFQKAAGVLLMLEEQGLPDEVVAADGDLPTLLVFRDGSLEPADGYPGTRATVAAAVARYFGGVRPEGPPWRVSDAETDRPSFAEFEAQADFGSVAA